MDDSAVPPNQKGKSESKFKTTGRKRKTDVSNSFGKLSKKNKKKKSLEINEPKKNDFTCLKTSKELKSECQCPALQVPLKKDKHGSKPLKEKDKDNNVMIKKKKRNSYLDTGAEEISTVIDNDSENDICEELGLNNYELSNTSVVISSDKESGTHMENDKPNWKEYSPLHHLKGHYKNVDVERLIKMGYKRNTGRWTADEIERLTKNMEEFLDNHKVIDYEGLILNRTKEDHLFRKKTQFVLKMCPGIFRTRHEIDNKITGHFGKPFFKTGRLSLEEINEFKKLHLLHGRRWKKIGLMLKRNANWMYHALHEHQSWNKGRWNLEEEKVLISSVLDLRDKGGRISWKSVSERVKTRSAKRCRRHWTLNFSQITNDQAFKRWITNIYNKFQEGLTNPNPEVFSFSDIEVRKLIHLVSDSNIDDEFLINWNELIKHFDNVPSAAWLKLKFQAVCKEVPYSHRLEFPELIEQLIDIYEKKENKDDVPILGERNDDTQIIEETDGDIEKTDTTDDGNVDDVQIIG